MVWLEDWSVRPGDSIAGETERGLSLSDILLFCVSGASLRSSWVLHVLRSAMALAERTGKPRIIPVVMEEYPPPHLLLDLKSFDLRCQDDDNSERLRQLLAAVHMQVAPHPQSSHRFVEYECTADVGRDGGCRFLRNYLVAATGSPLSSLPVVFVFDELPSMQEDNISFVYESHARIRGSIAGKSKSMIYVDFQISPHLAEEEPPLPIAFQFNVKKCYPSTRRELEWQRDRGVVDWSKIYQGVVLPVSADRFRFRLQTPDTVSTPELRVLSGREGEPVRIELGRIMRDKPPAVQRYDGSVLFDLSVENMIPGLWYGAEWEISN